MKENITIYTRENVRQSIGSYTKGNAEHECAIRDGVYCRHIDNDYKKEFQPDAYIVDFSGNIFYNEKAGGEMKLVSDEQFIQAKKDGFRCARNLTDSEIFAMKDIIDDITSIHKAHT